MRKKLLFVFDNLLYPFYAEREMGSAMPHGVGRLEFTALKFTINSNNGIPKADLVKSNDSKDYVLGIVYAMNSGEFNNFCKARRKSFGMETKQVSIVLDNVLTEVSTLVPINTAIAQNSDAFDWYLNFMVEGAKMMNFPSEYISHLQSFPTQLDPLEFRSFTFSDMLYYKNFTKKKFDTSISFIDKLNKGGKFKVSCPGHGYHRQRIEIRKAEKGFKFSTVVPLKKGIQDHKELKVDKIDITFDRKALQLYTTGEHFFSQNLQYDFDNSLKLIDGTISEIATCQREIFETSFLRTLIPVATKMDISNDFQSFQYLTNGSTKSGLIKLNINENEVHFYSMQFNDRSYIGIDIMQRVPLKQMNETVHAILLVFALLKGKFLSGEAYTLAFEDDSMELPIGILYQQMNDAILDLPGAFTTNAYTGIDTRNLTRDESGQYRKVDIDAISENMDYFSAQVYSKLCEEILSNDKVLRSLVLLVNNQNATLEIKIPVQYVVLETITATFVNSGNKELKPIQDDKIAGELLNQLKVVCDDFIKAKHFSEEDINKMIPFLRKLETLNSPPNADKLSKSFDIIEYSLSTQEKKVINQRNKFLHGSTVNISSDDYGFKELFYISARLNFLLTVLLLKKAEFKGKIINYVKLWEHITEIYTDEEPLVKI